MVDMVHSMRTFVRVVEAGTFTAVARESNVTTAQVSRAVSLLEDELQTLLLHRTTRHLSVTEAGAKYFERAKLILAELDNATVEARNAMSHAHGRLRVHAAPGLARGAVTAALIAYQARHPDVSVDLEVAQIMPNLVEDGYDVSLVGSMQLPDSAYIAQKLGSSHAVLAASPAYLERHGIPTRAEDLAQHTLLRFSCPGMPLDEWPLEGADGSSIVTVKTSPFQTNVPDAMRYALQSGAGIGVLAAYNAVDDLRSGALVRVLPQWRLRQMNVYALYVSRRYLDAKTRTLVDFLREWLTPALAKFEHEIDLLAQRDIAQQARDNAATPDRSAQQTPSASVQTVH
ncbi:LysR family transcriptional regulator [Paraburkholderia rhizosphaerae]|uniref:DNA-binding transcriptional LysR family regulator n=1 Tax=Paraburkholderia rhizosphaerae TaxID=480658 RepID=A0A4R8LH04_9BURK|nr:LysR family transcriptional regulator [Paraburkholderia rhizosphaerae]TDY42438.1 DNA-binding transcriptional LysR family regulator [Paraburkholderia rhizosphaerae]